LEISEAQKTIAQLEVENNLFRKEIHDSQTVRVKKLKQYNEQQQKIDEKKFIASNKSKVGVLKSMLYSANVTDPKIILPSVIYDTDHKICKSLYAEHTYHGNQRSKWINRFRNYDNAGILTQKEDNIDKILLKSDKELHKTAHHFRSRSNTVYNELKSIVNSNTDQDRPLSLP
jgi:hypothetical protein